MEMRIYYVYILVNKYHNVLYTGITNDLVRRCIEHKSKKVKGFTQKYNVDKLVFYEIFDQVDEAISREKQIKKYSRKKKLALIESFNREWKDLYKDGRIETPGQEREDSDLK